MVEVSSMEIVGMADTSDIDRGFQRIGDNFNVLESQAESSNMSLGRLAEITGKIGKSLVAMGTAGVTALMGIASQAPAVAPHMARLGTEFQRMKMQIGEELEPVFGSLAEDIFPWVAEKGVEAASMIANAFENTKSMVEEIIAIKEGERGLFHDTGNPEEVADSDIILPLGVLLIGRDMPDEPDEDAGLLERGRYRVLQFFESITNAISERNIEEYIGRRQRTA